MKISSIELEQWMCWQRFIFASYAESTKPAVKLEVDLDREFRVVDGGSVIYCGPNMEAAVDAYNRVIDERAMGRRLKQ